ncbi:uncharacterized protein VP01_11557g1, partial [Puccinia sorghi]
PNSMVLAKPQPFKGTRGAAAESFQSGFCHLIHDGLHSNLVSTIYEMKVFNTEEVAFDEFLDDFNSSFFDHNCQHHAEVALQSLRQTGTVLAYTQEFNSHTCTENVQLAVVMSNIKFTYLRTMQEMSEGRPDN